LVPTSAAKTGAATVAEKARGSEKAWAAVLEMASAGAWAAPLATTSALEWGNAMGQAPGREKAAATG
jgi:hypothetical protein